MDGLSVGVGKEGNACGGWDGVAGGCEGTGEMVGEGSGDEGDGTVEVSGETITEGKGFIPGCETTQLARIDRQIKDIRETRIIRRAITMSNIVSTGICPCYGRVTGMSTEIEEQLLK